MGIIIVGIVVDIIMIKIGADKFSEPESKIIKQTNQTLTERGTDNLRVTYPLANNEIISPLVVKGEARGTWYFEASFPVVLTNWDGLIIAEGIAQAQSDWMTEDFVPFIATLNFEKPSYGKNGFLILKKDNPSGLSQNDDSLEIPINFK